MTLKGLKILVTINVVLAFIAIALLVFLSNSAHAKPVMTKDEIVVVVVDTGVDYDIPAIKEHVPEQYRVPANKDVLTYHGRYVGHGTHVAGLILDGVCKEVKLIPCVFFNGENGKLNVQKTVACFNFAKSVGADIVNYSAGGIEPNYEEYTAIKSLSEAGTKIVVAAGNDHKPLYINPVFKKSEEINVSFMPPEGYESYFPACYDLPNIIRVQNLDEQGKLADTSNYNKLFFAQTELFTSGKSKVVPHVEGFDAEVGVEVESYHPGGVRAKMTGTSQAAAKVTNRILKQMCNELKAQ